MNTSDPKSTLLYKKYVHSSVGHDDENTRKDGEADYVAPQSERVHAKSAENRCAGDLNVEAVFTIDESQVDNLIDAEGFKAVVEDGELMNVSDSLHSRVLQILLTV